MMQYRPTVGFCDAADDASDTTFVFHSEHAGQAGYLTLGEVVLWMASRGRPASLNLVFNQYEGLYNELFQTLDRHTASKPDLVQGVRQDGPNEYVALPPGIWARMTEFGDPSFTTIDDTSEWGGKVWVEQKKWSGVRIPAALALRLWSPMNPTLPNEATKSSTERSKRRAQPKREIARRALAVLFPAGVPSQSEVSDAELFHKVGLHLGKNCPSDETILRAAGRRTV